MFSAGTSALCFSGGEGTMLDGRSVEDKSAQGLSVRPHKSVHGCFRGRDKEGSQEEKLFHTIAKEKVLG